MNSYLWVEPLFTSTYMQQVYYLVFFLFFFFFKYHLQDIILLFFYYFLGDFIYLFDRERQREREREKENKHKKEQQREREKQAPHRAGSQMLGSIPGPEIKIWAEGRRLTDWATKVPQKCNFK